MNMRAIRDFIKADPSWAAFLAFAFLSMLSLPLARAALVVSFVLTLRDGAARRAFRLTPPGWGWIAYLALATVVTGAVALANSEWGVAHGLMPAVDPYIEPARGFRKLTKLLWFLAIPLTVAQVRTAARFQAVLHAWALGGLLLALSVVLLHPPVAWLQVHGPTAPAWLDRLLSDPVWVRSGGRPPTFNLGVSYLGTMHDAQRLLVALVASACALPSLQAALGPRRRGLCWLGLAIVALGLVMTCKRGPLLVGILISGAVLAARIRWWKTLAALLLVCLAAWSLPHVRTRLAALPDEFDVRKGGRMLMWTRVVPALHAEYPYGLGFRSLTAIKMHNADWHVEKNRTHVHSVPLQAFVDFGYAGIAFWFLWMALAFRAARRLRRRGPDAGLSPGEALVPAACLGALVLFGLVEYNLADAAVVPLYSLAMGLGSCHAGLPRISSAHGGNGTA